MTGDRLDAYDADRPRGILTRRERRYLIGKSDIEEPSQDERGVRQAIREHLRHVLLDFQIIMSELEGRDRNQLIPDDDFEKAPPLRGGLTSMVSFAYQLEDHTEEAFEETTEHAVEWAEQERGWQATADSTLTVDRGERLDKLSEIARTEGIGNVSPRDRAALIMTGKIDPEEWMEERSSRDDGEE